MCASSHRISGSLLTTSSTRSSPRGAADDQRFDPTIPIAASGALLRVEERVFCNTQESSTGQGWRPVAMLSCADAPFVNGIACILPVLLSDFLLFARGNLRKNLNVALFASCASLASVLGCSRRRSYSIPCTIFQVVHSSMSVLS